MQRGVRTGRAALAFVVAVSLFATACNDKALEAGTADGGKRLGGAISAEQAAKVLARVGDHTITLGEFVAAIEHMDQFDRLRYQSPEKRKELLAEMINMQLLADEAHDKGYDKDPHVQQEIRAVLRDAMLAEAHKDAPNAAELSLADVHAYYDQNRASFREPERRRLSVIVLQDEASASSALEAAKKATTAVAWGELVRAKSIDSAAKANVPVDLAGDFGLVSAPNEVMAEPNAKVPPEVRAAVFEIPKIGDVYDKVVKASDRKFYVVRLTQKTDAHERTFAEAERTIRVRLVQDKIRQREEALIAKLKTDFPVQIDDAVLATVHVNMAESGDAGGAEADGGAHVAPSASANGAPRHPPTP